MIKRIIEDRHGNRLEVSVIDWGIVSISIGQDCLFQFENDEDVHCFISELQGAMLRAKGEKKEEESNEEEEKFAVDTGDGKPIDPIDLKYRRDNPKHTHLCNCGKPMFTDQCTSRGCNNWNVFGQGTVDTTSNGTE